MIYVTAGLSTINSSGHLQHFSVSPSEHGGSRLLSRALIDMREAVWRQP